MLIKYIKSVLWRVAKCLSYIEEARCLKVKGGKIEREGKTVIDKYTTTISNNERDHFVLDYYYFTSLGTEQSLRTAAAVHILPRTKPSFAENLDSDVRHFSHNYEKRLLALSCLSVRPRGTTWPPLE